MYTRSPVFAFPSESTKSPEAIRADRAVMTAEHYAADLARDLAAAQSEFDEMLGAKILMTTELCDLRDIVHDMQEAAKSTKARLTVLKARRDALAV